MTFKGHSRSLEMSRFDRVHMISFYCSMVTMGLPILYRFPHRARYWLKVAKCIYPPILNAPHGVTLSEFRKDV